MPDVPGEMLKVTKIMTDIKASFSQIIQTKNPDQTARVVIITHDMSKEQLAQLTERLRQTQTIELLAAYKVMDKG